LSSAVGRYELREQHLLCYTYGSYLKKVEESKIGGNALKTALTRRHNRDEYINKTETILGVLTSHVHEANFLKSYKSKETFGDTDIVYSTESDLPISVSDVQRIFRPTEIVKNGSVISFDYEELQVDLIFSSKAEYNYAISYGNFNDLGNLIGKLAHQLGLKHGHRGLTLPIRDRDNIVGEVILTLRHRTTLEFLGLDADRFDAGFDTLEDIFKFVRSSKYFNPESYKLENLNNIAKMRDKKRTTYGAFLGYNEANPVRTPYVKSADKSVHLPHIFDYFGDVALEKYKSITKELAATRYIKTRFNGDMVSKLTGYTGKGLGQFMQHLKKNEFLLQPHSIPLLSDSKIEEIVMKNAKQFDEVLGSGV
jgi:hypothetical protein